MAQKKSKSFVYEKEAIKVIRQKSKEIGASDYAIKSSIETAKRQLRQLRDEMAHKNLTLAQKNALQKQWYNAVKKSEPTRGKTFRPKFSPEIKARPLSKTAIKREEVKKNQRIKKERKESQKRFADLQESKVKSKKSRAQKKATRKQKEIKLAEAIEKALKAQQKQQNGNFLQAGDVVKNGYMQHLRNRFKAEYGRFPTNMELNFALDTIRMRADNELRDRPGIYGYVNNDEGAYNYVEDVIDMAEQDFFAVER